MYLESVLSIVALSTRNATIYYYIIDKNPLLLLLFLFLLGVRSEKNAKYYYTIS